jgi:hypothetical protein
MCWSESAERAMPTISKDAKLVTFIDMSSAI